MRSPSRFQSDALWDNWVTLPSLTTLVRTLPTHQLLSLWTAIFSTGLMVGFSMDLLLEGREPIVRLAMNVVSSGAFFIFYFLFSLPVRIWRIVAVTAGHLVFITVSSRAFPLLPDAPPGRLTLDAVGIFATMLVGQTMFLHFINVTAARYLRAQAESGCARVAGAASARYWRTCTPC